METSVPERQSDTEILRCRDVDWGLFCGSLASHALGPGFNPQHWGEKEGVATCKLLTVNNLMSMLRESHCI